MARQPKPQLPQQPAQLTLQQMTAGINLLKKRLEDVRGFDPLSVTDQHNAPQLDALEASIDDALVRTFGADTLDYERYKSAKDFNRGPYNYMHPTPPHKFQASISRSKDRSVALLGEAIKSLEEQLEEHSANPPVNQTSPETPRPPSRKVFLVHGRDNDAKNEVARFLGKIGLEEIILHERPNSGRHLLTKFQEESEGASFAVVLITPDDEGGLSGEAPRKRARQNVVFELGFFIGKLGAARVAPLVKGDVEKPSDFDGVGYIALDPAGAWKGLLARELKAAKVPFEAEKVFEA
jgi:predicted nucleotide-binding protein